MPSFSQAKGKPTFVLALCALTMLGDGFDLTIYGATLPSLMYEFGATKQALANVHSVTLAAMMVGFLVAGPLADRIGRRNPIIIGAFAFSTLNLACAFATSLTMFAGLRIASGFFLGAVVPSLVAMVSEYAPPGKKQLYNGITMIGFPLGGILVTVVSLNVLPTAASLRSAFEAGAPLGDWRWTYAVAGLFLLLIPAMWFRLPESPGYLLSKGFNDAAHTTIKNWDLDPKAILGDREAALAAGTSGYRLILSNKYIVATVIFTLIVFCTQVLTYGPNTWIPQMISAMGYDGMQGTWALLCLSIGSVVGTYIGSRIADRGEATLTIILYLAVNALSLIALAFGREIGTVGIFIAAFACGFTVIGAASLMYGVIAQNYPVTSRGSAIGFCVGFARFGGILGPQIGAFFTSPKAGLLAFMALAVIGTILVIVLRIYNSTQDRGESVAAPAEGGSG